MIVLFDQPSQSCSTTEVHVRAKRSTISDPYMRGMADAGAVWESVCKAPYGEIPLRLAALISNMTATGMLPDPRFRDMQTKYKRGVMDCLTALLASSVLANSAKFV